MRLDLKRIDWRAVFVLILLATERGAQDARSDFAEADKLNSIRHRLEAFRRIGDAELNRATNDLSHGQLLTMGMSIVVLGEAIDYNLYSRFDLLNRIEERAKRESSPAIMAELVGGYRRMAANIGGTDNDDYSNEATELETADARKLSAVETQFIAKLMNEPKVQNRLLAARLLAIKRGLSASDYSFAQRLVQREIERSKDGVKAYWGFVSRVMRFRNPPSRKTSAAIR